MDLGGLLLEALLVSRSCEDLGDLVSSLNLSEVPFVGLGSSLSLDLCRSTSHLSARRVCTSVSAFFSHRNFTPSSFSATMPALG